MRRVLYLYLPGWPIDRLRRLGIVPSLAAAPADDRPFATIAEAAGNRLLAAVNPAAAAAGLAPGMPLADALSFFPALATRPAEPQADAAALVRLAEWCGRYSPWTAADLQSGDADGIKIEITGCAHLWGGEAQLAADLACRLKRQHIAHRIAIAGTLGAAYALARFAAEEGRPAQPEPDAERAAMAPLPVEALRLDPLTVTGLRRVGLKRIGELYPMPRDALARRFDEGVVRRLDQALGEEPEPLSPLGEAPARRVRLSFAEPILDPTDFAIAIERLTGDLAARLAGEGMGARRLDLAFHRVDGRVEHIRIGTARPSRDSKHLAGLLAARLETVDPGLGVEDMILALYAAEPLAAEQIGLDRTANEAKDGIAPLLDRLGAYLGLDALHRLEPHASHIPERASAYVTVAESPHPNPPAAGEGAAAPPKPPRPIRLFRPPEPVEAAWLLPDDPPFHFTWRRRLHRVKEADGPERIAEEWWVAGDQWSPGAIRDYYRVEDEEGRRFWLFRAGLPGDPPPRWFLHGLFA